MKLVITTVAAAFVVTTAYAEHAQPDDPKAFVMTQTLQAANTILPRIA